MGNYTRSLNTAKCLGCHLMIPVDSVVYSGRFESAGFYLCMSCCAKLGSDEFSNPDKAIAAIINNQRGYVEMLDRHDVDILDDLGVKLFTRGR